MAGIVKDLTGQRFGKLLVLEFTGTRKPHNNPKMTSSAHWKCQCDCGNIVELDRSKLTTGNTKSCGCYWYEVMQLPDGIGALNSIYGRYKSQAKEREYSFDLSIEEFKGIVDKNCFYCNTPPNNLGGQKKNNGRYKYNGVDRLDNTKGYSVSNCVPCCKRCNRAKDTHSIESFYKWIEDVYRNMSHER